MKSEFLEAFLNGELDDQQREVVEKALCDDKDLREAYFDQLEIDEALRVLLSQKESGLQFSEGVMARLRSEGAGNTDRGFSRSVLTTILEEREGIRPIRWPDLIKASVVAAAASVALMFFLQTIIFPHGFNFPWNSGKAVGPGGYIARMEETQDAVWSSSTQAKMKDGGWVNSGLIELESGQARFAFNSGASALVEGPAILSLETSNRLFLEKGKLTAEAPPAASGFTVNTPRMNVVDIGTRFGVLVDEQGNSEVHVMEGEVEASRSSGNSVSVLLREGLAIRADDRTRTELQPVPYAGDSFAVAMGASRNSLPHIFYPFEESTGGGILDATSGNRYDAELKPGAGTRNSPLRAPGYEGTGLVFQRGQSLTTPLDSSFRLEDAHSIGLWVKVAPVPGKEESSTILRYGREGTSWNVRCNFDPMKGTTGALQIACGDGYLTGSTDLSDGVWHHIAYRYLGAVAGRDATSRLHLFVDGNIENLSGWKSIEPRKGRSSELTIGSSHSDGFSGWVDNFRFYQNAASTRTIQSDSLPIKNQ